MECQPQRHASEMRGIHECVPVLMIHHVVDFSKRIQCDRRNPQRALEVIVQLRMFRLPSAKEQLVDREFLVLIQDERETALDVPDDFLK